MDDGGECFICFENWGVVQVLIMNFEFVVFGGGFLDVVFLNWYFICYFCLVDALKGYVQVVYVFCIWVFWVVWKDVKDVLVENVFVLGYCGLGVGIVDVDDDKFWIQNKVMVGCIFEQCLEILVYNCVGMFV